MRRREFIALLGGAAAWPLTARAQQAAKTPRIGLLAPGQSEGTDASRVTLNSLVAGLRELGYIEGQNIVVERRFGEFDSDRLRDLAAELAESQVDVIVAFSTTAAFAAKRATSLIPIVAIAMADPVADELVVSLARPGGNVTGTTFLGPELVAKRLQLLKEVVPQLSRVAILWHPHAYSDRTMAGMVKEIEGAAQTLGIPLQLVPTASPEDIAGAFSAIIRERASALSVFPSPMLFSECQTGGVADTAADQIRAGHQSEDGESTRPDDYSRIPATYRRCDRVSGQAICQHNLLHCTSLQLGHEADVRPGGCPLLTVKRKWRGRSAMSPCDP